MPVSSQRDVLVLRDLLTKGGLDALDWRRWEQPGRSGVDIHPLYTTPDEPTGTAFIVRMGAGAHGDLHEHLGYELMFVLDGELRNDNGDRYAAGDLIVERPGSAHRVS